MRYGYFDDAAREYVITRPDTPLPWINYLGSEAYFGLISNTAGGYSFYRDARLRRITRYRYNNVPLDYRRALSSTCETMERATFWSPSWQPVRSRWRPILAGTVSATASSARPAGGSRRARPTLCHLGEKPGSLARAADQSTHGAGAAFAFLGDRILPVGRPRRRDELPAQLQHRPGGGRRWRHLPQDRVPGAARSFCLLCLLRAAGGDRIPIASSFLGPYRGWDAPRAVEQRPVVQLARPRLGADRLAPGEADVGARRDPRDHLPARLCREPGG